MDSKTLEDYFEQALEDYEQTYDTTAIDYDDLEEQCKRMTTPKNEDVAKVKELIDLYLTIDRRENFNISYELEQVIVKLIKQIK